MDSRRPTTIAAGFVLLVAMAAPPIHASESLGHTICGPAAPAWLTLEIVDPGVGVDDPLEWIEITESGCVAVRYTASYRAAGVYETMLPAASRQVLADRIGRMPLNLLEPSTLERMKREVNVKRAKSGDRTIVVPLVSDASRVRLRIAEEHGKTRDVIVESPERFAPLYPELAALQAFAEIIEDIRSQVRGRPMQKIAEVTP